MAKKEKYSVTDIIRGKRRQITDWDKIFAKTHLTKNISNSTTGNDAITKWAKDLNRHHISKDKTGVK